MLVSILIATFNRFNTTRQYLPKILDRIGNIEHEILIWDNASNDGTFDWLLEMQTRDRRIREIQFSNKNIGMEAFNHLAEMANGKYLLKVDDDIEVPSNFGERLVGAFEALNEPKLAYLGWDMQWINGSFALRSGQVVYQRWGKTVSLSDGSSVYISCEPDKWMINGVCRLSLKETFLKLGGHPAGALYGVDHYVSRQAKENGYWVGFYHTTDLIVHRGHDDPIYRQFKDKQLRLLKAPKHV